MASTYTLNSKKSYEGRKLVLTCTQTTNIATNTSTINWILSSTGGESAYYTTGPTTVKINGTQVYYKKRVNWDSRTFPASTGSVSGSLTVQHTADGSKSISVSLSTAIYTSTVTTNSGTWVLNSIPRNATITEAPNFTDIQNPTITYTNPAGDNVTSLQACISLTGLNDDIEYRDISTTGTSYTFNLTEAERNILRNATPNSNTLNVIFYIKTVISGVTLYSTSNKTMTIVNANPTLGSFTYADTNSTTTAITGNNQQIIQSNSTLQFTIGTATALKGASISSYVVSFNGSDYTPTNGIITISNPNVANNLNAVLTVTDSRGNTSSSTLPITVLAWSLPYALITLERQQNYYSETDLTVDGQYSSLDSKNTLTIQYQYKETSASTYSTLTTIQNNTLETINLDNTEEWNVKVILTDLLGSTTYNLTVGKGIPILFIDRLLRSVGFNAFPSKENQVVSEGVDLDDYIYIGSQVIYDTGSLVTEGEQTVLGSYDYGLIDNLFTGVNIPDDYEKAYRISAQVSTNGGNYASVMVNNIETYRLNTWSNQTYRKIVSSNYFKQSDIQLETTFGYTKPGTNLKLKNTYTAGNGTAYFWNVTVHAYLMKKTTPTVVAISEDYDDNLEPAT